MQGCGDKVLLLCGKVCGGGGNWDSARCGRLRRRGRTPSCALRRSGCCGTGLRRESVASRRELLLRGRWRNARGRGRRDWSRRLQRRSAFRGRRDYTLQSLLRLVLRNCRICRSDRHLRVRVGWIGIFVRASSAINAVRVGGRRDADGRRGRGRRRHAKRCAAGWIGVRIECGGRQRRGFRRRRSVWRVPIDRSNVRIRGHKRRIGDGCGRNWKRHNGSRHGNGNRQRDGWLSLRRRAGVCGDRAARRRRGGRASAARRRLRGTISDRLG